MVQNSLVKYIQEQIRAGYDTATIKSYLLRYGYTESQVNEAFQFAYPPTEVKHVVHFSKVTIVLIVAVVCSLLLLSFGIFVFLMPGKPAQLLDVKTELVKSSIKQGDKLYFTVELVNLGKAGRYDIGLRYEIRNLKDELITFKEETIALETKASSSVNLDLENISPGSYYLRTTASYKGGSAKATSRFSVVKEGTVIEPVTPPPVVPPTPTKRCPFSCDDNNECTDDYCNKETGYECMHNKKYNCCGNGICEENENYENCLTDCKIPPDRIESMFEGKTIWERIEIIKEIGKTDKEKAIGYCDKIDQITYRYQCFTAVAVSSNDKGLCLNIEDDISKDDCYREIAKETKNSEVCADIAKESKRDQCYMEFATKGDYSVCDKLVNKYLKQSCDSLKQLSEMKVPSEVSG